MPKVLNALIYAWHWWNNFSNITLGLNSQSQKKLGRILVYILKSHIKTVSDELIT